jgi:hypothetical protein
MGATLVAVYLPGTKWREMRWAKRFCIGNLHPFASRMPITGRSDGSPQEISSRQDIAKVIVDNLVVSTAAGWGIIFIGLIIVGVVATGCHHRVQGGPELARLGDRVTLLIPR